MREYKIAKGWAIFIYITVPLLIGLFGWLLFMPLISDSEKNLKIFWFLAPLSIAMICLMLIGLIDTVKGKFVIDTDRVFAVHTFSRKELMFTEIRGYRITDKYIFIEPNNEYKKKIKISTYFGNTAEIIRWLADNYPNLDIVQVNEEKEEILSDEAYGLTIAQREEKLVKARRTATILNWGGGLIGAWTLFYPRPYEYAIIVSIIFPVICVIVLKYFNGLIRMNEAKSTAYPSIFWAIFATCSGICLRGLLDYQVFDYSKIWTPAILITLAFIVFLIIGNKEFKFDKAKDYLAILSFSIFMFGYSYGVIVVLNCMYDKSAPEIFNATILKKRISTGKYTSYYVELTPWGQRNEADEVRVSKKLYTQLDQNDSVNIYFMKGRFGIPWYEVTE
ncbi:MAG: hypothetical protein QM687_03600 [Ferruginibacter sp.]